MVRQINITPDNRFREELVSQSVLGFFLALVGAPASAAFLALLRALTGTTWR